MSHLPVLSSSIFIPLISALYIACFPYQNNILDYKHRHVIYVSVCASILILIISIYLLINFDPTIQGYQYVEHYDGIQSIGLNFNVGVDGFSLCFIVLTALLTLICIIGSLFIIKTKIKEYLICFLLIESFCISAFSSLNLLLFYCSFEAILIPMYFIIGVWGGKSRTYAAVKFFLYTLFSSILMLITLIYIFCYAGTFEFIELENKLPLLKLKIQQYLWIATFISFAIKVPLPPFHTWLPDAHVQAPTTGSVMLAGVLLKLGGYALLRVSLTMFPEASECFAIYVMWISGIAVIYASLVALKQQNMKTMIAYSSIAHMGYAIAGMFSLTPVGISGAVFQMISHGLISSILFLIIGILYERHGTKDIMSYGGVASSMPILATIFMIAMLGSIGLPGFSGFLGELWSVTGAFYTSPAVGVLCLFGVVLSTAYMLRLYRCVMLGEVTDKSISNFKDLTKYEIIVCIPLILCIIYFGVKPQVIFTAINTPVKCLVGIYTVL